MSSLFCTGKGIEDANSEQGDLEGLKPGNVPQQRVSDCAIALSLLHSHSSSIRPIRGLSRDESEMESNWRSLLRHLQSNNDEATPGEWLGRGDCAIRGRTRLTINAKGKYRNKCTLTNK